MNSTLIIVLVYLLIHSNYIFSRNYSSNKYVPNYISQPKNNSPLVITSDTVVSDYLTNIIFSGNVNIQYGSKFLSANKIKIYQNYSHNRKKMLNILGVLNKVHYYDNQVDIYGSTAHLDLSNRNIDIRNCKYRLLKSNKNGNSDHILILNDKHYLVLINGTLTTCLSDKDYWDIIGSRIIFDYPRQLIKIRNARFRINSKNVFYSPYLKLSTKKNYYSGFYIPIFKISNIYGFTFSIPYNWSITPNIHVTFTPLFTSQYNTYLKSEIHYLNNAKSNFGSLNYELLNILNSRIFKKDFYNFDNLNYKWILHGLINNYYRNHWYSIIDFTKVNNPSYFWNSNSDYLESNYKYLTQKEILGFTKKNLNIELINRKFQILQNNYKNNYYIQPQIDINYFKDVNPLKIGIHMQITRFININYKYPNALRIHVEPAINFLFSNNWTNFDITFKALATHYQQNNTNWYNKTTDYCSYLKPRINRLLPEFSLKNKTIFSRITYYNKYTQLIEHNMQYLYIPYYDQSHIGVYDSNSIKNDDPKYLEEYDYHTGLDHISSSNKLINNVITTVYDRNLTERLIASISQVYTFNQPHVINDTFKYREQKLKAEKYTSDIYCKLTNYLLASSNLQFSNNFKDILSSNIMLEYKKNNVTIQFRYKSNNFKCTGIPLNNQNVYQKNISFIDTLIKLPLSSNWNIINLHHFDFQKKQQISEELSIQHKTNCYTIGINYVHKINSHTNFSKKFENKVSLSLNINGLQT